MIEAVLLGAGAAAGYGVADFLSGVWSRRVGIVAVLVVGNLAGTLVVSVAGPFVAPGSAAVSDLLWGSLAGAAAVVGVLLLLRGFQLGNLSIVSPASALAAAGTPVAFDVATGAPVSNLALVSMGVGLVAIWFVCSEPSSTAPSQGYPLAGLLYGLVSGVAFGGMFVALSQSSHESGAWPAISTQVTIGLGALSIVVARRQLPRMSANGVGAVALSGIAASLATLSFLLAARAGIVSVAAVVASLSPAVTVLLAWSVIHEPLGQRRVVGLIAAGVALIGLSLG